MVITKKLYYKIKHKHGKYYLINDNKEYISILCDDKDEMNKYYSNQFVKITKILNTENTKKEVDDIYIICAETQFIFNNKLELLCTDINSHKYLITCELEQQKTISLTQSEIAGIVQAFNFYCNACTNKTLCEQCALKALANKIITIIDYKNNN